MPAFQSRKIAVAAAMRSGIPPCHAWDVRRVIVANQNVPTHLPQPSSGQSNPDQELGDILVLWHLVKLHHLAHFHPPQDFLDGGHRILHLFHLDTVPQQDRPLSFPLFRLVQCQTHPVEIVQHDTGTIEHLDPLVEDDFLHDPRLTRHGGHRTCSGTFERVDEGGFTDVGVTDETDRQGLMRVGRCVFLEKL